MIVSPDDQQVNVVEIAAGGDERAVFAANDAADVLVEPLPDVVRDRRLTVLRGPQEVVEERVVGVAHDGRVYRRVRRGAAPT